MCDSTASIVEEEIDAGAEANSLVGWGIRPDALSSGGCGIPEQAASLTQPLKLKNALFEICTGW